MRRGVFLAAAACIVIVTSLTVQESPQEVKAEGQKGFHEINVSTAQPVMIPYLDMDIRHLSCIMELDAAAGGADPEETPGEEDGNPATDEQKEGTYGNQKESGVAGGNDGRDGNYLYAAGDDRGEAGSDAAGDSAEYDYTGRDPETDDGEGTGSTEYADKEGAGETTGSNGSGGELGTNAEPDNRGGDGTGLETSEGAAAGTGEDPMPGGDSLRELDEPEETPGDESRETSGRTLTYLGEWTVTAYCPCEICCGEWAGGYTASGTLATSGRTAACGILPFGSRILIDDTIYTVEDRGVEGAWIDIFFDTHEEALTYGMQNKSVYLIEE